MQTIGITGGTGFIGSHLAPSLAAKGHKVIILSRSARRKPADGITYAHWDPYKKECDFLALGKLDALVHLAGAGIADKRLTDKRKKEIIDSRVQGTDFLLTQLRQHAPNCKTLVSASAIGYYGTDKPGGPPFTESAPCGGDFMAVVCGLWEGAAQKGSDFLRTVIIRTGIVLGKDGGAYPRLVRPLSFGIMPILGSGRQMVSWISIDDLIGIYTLALENDRMAGIYNAAAPNPVTHSQMMHTIARAKKGIHIPAPAPAWLLKLALGEVADEVLKSCTVSPQKVLDVGYAFHHPDIKAVVEQLVHK